MLGKDNKQFNLNLPKKDLVGRAVVYCIKDKKWIRLMQFMFSEQCTIVDVDQKSVTVVLSFNMFGSDYYKKSILDVEVLSSHRFHP